MRQLLDSIAVATVLAGAAAAWGATGDMTLSARAGNSELVLKTCTRFAGAVCSIRYRGKEHIDTHDHGRLLQSASSFDRYGECYNPTEGGTARDAGRSTSVLRAVGMQGNQIWTLADMAFWWEPGRSYPQGCGTRREITRAVNTARVSGHLLEKQITVGLPDFPNVIEHRVTYYVPERYAHGVFEASTGYMPREFSLALYYDPASGTESDPGDRQGEQALPVILATPDRRYAMGVYSHDLPQNKRLGYGRFTFRDVVKWNCVFREDDVQPGAYTYRCLVALGSVSEVQDTLRRLHRLKRSPGALLEEIGNSK